MRTPQKNITDTLRWVNPQTNVEVKLGSMIAENLVINPEHKELLSRILPFDNMSFDKRIGSGIQANAYLSRFKDRKFVFKIYKNKDLLLGIRQFRCLRKIKMLGYNTPEVYVAAPSMLLMDYIPNPTIEEYVVNNPGKKGQKVYDLWIEQMFKIDDILCDEIIDYSKDNGYIIQDTPEVKLGIFDQG